jgi:hypothetical protein
MPVDDVDFEPWTSCSAWTNRTNDVSTLCLDPVRRAALTSTLKLALRIASFQGQASRGGRLLYGTQEQSAVGEPHRLTQECLQFLRLRASFCHLPLRRIH